jgi:hypothetical protein
VYAFSAFGLLGLLFYYSKKKQKQRADFKQQQQYANEEIYNLMLAQQILSKRAELKKRKELGNCMMAF